MKNENTIIDLLVSELRRLDEVSKAEVYTDILKHKSNRNKKKLSDINKDELVSEFINSKLNVSENTIKNYKSVFFNLLKSIHPSINKDSIIRYLKIKDDKWSPNTKRRNYIIIRGFMKFLFKAGYLDEDISEYIKIPNKVTVRQFVPNDKDNEILFSTLNRIYKKEEDRILFYTIFFIYIKTGLRLRELIGLDYQDIDFNHSRIILNQTKNGDKADMPIDEQLKDIIRNYINSFNINDGALIRGKGSRRIDKNVINDNLKKIVKESGLSEKLTAHAFRRYFIDKHRRAGTSVFVLQELARHKDINTTQGYCNITEEDKLSAMGNIQIPVQSRSIESASSLPVVCK